MNIEKKYVDLILVPLEKEIHNLKVNFYIKNFTFNKKLDNEYIENIENLLLQYYKNFETFIDDSLIDKK